MKNFEVLTDGSLITVKSVDPIHQASPKWNFPIWMYAISDSTFILDLKKFLEDEEQYILNRYPALHDGGTALGNNTVTSRFHKFNLLRLQRPVVQQLKQIIEFQFKQFVTKYLPDILTDTEFEPVINCWYNVMLPNQEITVHTHSCGPTSFFSGHFTVACEESETYYVCPISNDRLDFKNSPGEGIFFPSYIAHGTSKHIGNEKRITVAFDIYYKKEYCTDIVKDNTIKIDKEKLCS